jgi:hypothetical protein
MFFIKSLACEHHFLSPTSLHTRFFLHHFLTNPDGWVLIFVA